MVELLPFLVVILVFWFLIIRPQRRRQAQMQALQRSAQEGSEVMLTSGIFGTITNRTDDYVVVEIAAGVEIRVIPAAIGSIVHPDVDDATDVADHDETETPDAKRAPDAEEN